MFKRQNIVFTETLTANRTFTRQPWVACAFTAQRVATCCERHVAIICQAYGALTAIVIATVFVHGEGRWGSYFGRFLRRNWHARWRLRTWAWCRTSWRRWRLVTAINLCILFGAWHGRSFRIRGLWSVGVVVRWNITLWLRPVDNFFPINVGNDRCWILVWF